MGSFTDKLNELKDKNKEVWESPSNNMPPMNPTYRKPPKGERLKNHDDTEDKEQRKYPRRRKT